MRENRILNSYNLPLMLCCITGGIALVAAMILLIRNRAEQKQLESLVDHQSRMQQEMQVVPDSTTDANRQGGMMWFYPTSGQASGMYIKPEPLK